MRNLVGGAGRGAPGALRRTTWGALGLALLLGVGAPTGAHAAEAPPPAPPAPASEALPRLMVLDFQAVGASPQAASAAGGVAANELQRLGVFTVSTSETLRDLLALERQKQLLGCPDESPCATQLAGALGVDYLVTGKVTRISGAGGMPTTFTLEMVLTDVKAGKRVGADLQTAQAETEAVSKVKAGVTRLVGRALQGRAGTLFVQATELGAVVKVDDVVQGVTPLQGRLKVAAGPHLLTVEKAGFVTAQKEVRVRADAHAEEAVTLVPSPDFVREYQSRHRKLRLGAYVSTGVAVAGLAGAALFQLQADRNYGDATTPGTFEYERALVNQGVEQDEAGDHRRMANDLKARIETQQLLSRVGAGLALAGAGAATYFWIAGEDPDRYSRFLTVGAGPDGPSAGVVLRF